MTLQQSKNRIPSLVFIGALATIPLLSEFWNLEWWGAKVNWLPILAGTLSCIVILFRSERTSLGLYLAIVAFYFVLVNRHGGDFESLVRIVISLLPLLIVSHIQQTLETVNTNVFFKWYSLILLVPFSISILQLAGEFPFYDEGPTYDFFPSGRISGGYMKPNNLCAYFFPLYLYGFYLVWNKRKAIGMIIISLCLILVFVSALRTAVVIYFLVFAASFFKETFNSLIDRYYRYFLHFVFAIIGFFILYLLFANSGPIDGMRYRLPMWQAHTDHFFNGDIISMIFGSGDVTLPDSYRQFGQIRSFNEAHNNTIRTVITFGVFGFLLYCLLLRSFVLKVGRIWRHDPQRLFIANACILYYLVYSITNEPAFYPSIAWSVLVWVFLNGAKDEVAGNHGAIPPKRFF